MTSTPPEKPQLTDSQADPEAEQETSRSKGRTEEGEQESERVDREISNDSGAKMGTCEPNTPGTDPQEAYEQAWTEHARAEKLQALLDAELKLVRFAPELAQRLRYPGSDMLGIPVDSCFTASSRQPLQQALNDLAGSEDRQRNLIAALLPLEGDPLSAKLTFTRLELQGPPDLPPAYLMEVELAGAEVGNGSHGQDLPLLDLEPLPVPMMLVDQNDRIQWINSAAQSLFGFVDREQANGELFSMLIVGEGAELRPLERVLSLKGEALDVQIRLRTKGGIQFVAEVTAAALRDTEGDKAGFVALFRDITKRLLQESQGADEAHFQARLVRSAPVGLALIDSDHRLITFNPSLSRLLGYDEASMRHRRLEDLVQPNLAERLESELDRLLLLHESIPITLELQGRRRDGTPRPLSLHLASSPDGWGVVAVFMDSSSQRAAIDQVKAMEERYRQLFENNDQTMVLADDDGYIMDANQVACELFGLSKEQMVGRHVEDVLGTYGGSEERRTMPTPDPSDRETTPLGAGLLTEQDKRQLERVLREQNMAALGHLVAGVAHHINNPLAFIRANASNLSDNLAALEEVLEASQALAEAVDRKPTVKTEAPLHKFKEVVQEVRPEMVLERLRKEQKSSLDGLERIAKLTEQLRAFGKLEAQKPQMANVRQCLELTLELVKPTFGSKVELKEELQTMPPTYCQPAMLNTLFQALLVNASQAVGEQGVIEVSCRATEANLEVRISDDGPGMPERLQRNIFNPLFTTRHESLGMGLAVAYSIVKLHDGDIEVDSMVGRGTTFIVRLPIRSPSDGESETDRSRPSP